MTISMKFLAILPIITIVGLIVPIMIPTNVNKYSGDQKMFARYAVVESYNVHNPITLSLRHHVQSVQELSVNDPHYLAESDAAQRCGRINIGIDEKGIAVSKPYEAIITEYTIFGIPSGRVHVWCTGESARSF